MPVAVRLGIPDLVGAGESTAEVIAGRLNADQDAVYRILRCLAGIGMLTEERSGVFALTPMGKQLTVDAPFGLPALARMLGDSSVQRAFERLDDSVRTGRSAFDLEFGVDFFDYLGQNPEFSDLFNSAMGQNARLVADALPERYDFDRFGSVVDVGGGNASLLAAILRAHIPHDWSGDDCATILRNIRSVIPDDGRLLIIDSVLPEVVDGNTLGISYLLDLMMMAVGGRERTPKTNSPSCVEHPVFSSTKRIRSVRRTAAGSWRPCPRSLRSRPAAAS